MIDDRRGSALGIFEVTGAAALTVAIDAMLKAASVNVVSRQTVGGGRVATSIRGDIASVQAALAAGEAAVAAFTAEPRAVCLGRPLEDVVTMVDGASEVGSSPAAVASASAVVSREPHPIPEAVDTPAVDSTAKTAPAKRPAAKRPAAKKAPAKKAPANRKVRGTPGRDTASPS